MKTSKFNGGLFNDLAATIGPYNKPVTSNYQTHRNRVVRNKSVGKGAGDSDSSSGGCDVVVRCDSVSNYRSANDLFHIPTIGLTDFFSLFNADRLPVDGSTCIRSIGIDDNGRLEIEFQNEGVYQYDCHGVEPVVMEDILDADSRGQFYNGHVRGQYPSYKIKGGLKGVSHYKPSAGGVRNPRGKILDWRESFKESSDVDYPKVSKFRDILHGLGLLRKKSQPVTAKEGDWS